MSAPADDDRDVWLAYRWAAGADPAIPEPDAATIAAWLDGTLSDAERDAVDAYLASDAEALEAVLAAAAAREDAHLDAPAAVVHRAKSLVAEATARRPWLRRFEWMIAPLPVRGMAAASVVVAALAGFQLGNVTFEKTLFAEVAVAEALTLGAESLPLTGNEGAPN